LCHNSRTGFFKSASLKVNEPVSLGLVVHWSEVVNPADPSRLTQQYVRSYVVCSIKDSANRLLARSVRELIRETPAKFAAVSRRISLHTNAIVLSLKRVPMLRTHTMSKAAAIRAAKSVPNFLRRAPCRIVRVPCNRSISSRGLRYRSLL